MQRQSEKPVVTITGVTGFIGSQVCYSFLKNGQFRVRGTVRSKTNLKKLLPIQDGFGDLFNELELIEADLNSEASMIEACRGSDYVVHTASPFFT